MYNPQRIKAICMVRGVKSPAKFLQDTLHISMQAARRKLRLGTFTFFEIVKISKGLGLDGERFLNYFYYPYLEEIEQCDYEYEHNEGLDDLCPEGYDE